MTLRDLTEMRPPPPQQEVAEHYIQSSMKQEDRTFMNELKSGTMRLATKLAEEVKATIIAICNKYKTETSTTVAQFDREAAKGKRIYDTKFAGGDEVQASHLRDQGIAIFAKHLRRGFAKFAERMGTNQRPPRLAEP